MSPTEITILGLILELIGFFILIFISLVGYSWLFNRIGLTDNTPNRFGRFLQRYFCWGTRQTPDYGLQRFSSIIAFFIVMSGTIMQIVAISNSEILFENISFFDLLPILTILAILILFICWLIFRDATTRNFINTLFTIIIVIFAFFSAFYVYQTVDWYQNPQPLYQSWTNVDSEIRDSGEHLVKKWTGYSPYDGLQSSLEGWNNFEIKVYINNAGRAPITGAVMEFKISTDNLTAPFPFKIRSISTPLQWIKYDIKNKTLYDDFGQNRTNHWRNKYSVYDFPPILKTDGTTYEPDGIWGLRIGTIAPEQTVEIEIGLFATIDNATAELELTITSENEPDHYIGIPLKSN